MKVKYQILRKCGHSFLIPDNLHLMSQLHQDQGVLVRCIKQFSPKVIDSDIQCRIHVKLSSDNSDLIVTIAAIFNSKMGNPESQTFVDESWARFVELWTSGKSATFHVDCWNGEARLYFSTILGTPGDLSNRTESARTRLFSTTKVKSQKKYSPSKLKRNQLRLQAFLKKKRQESCNDTTESVNKQVIGDNEMRQESPFNSPDAESTFWNPDAKSSSTGKKVSLERSSQEACCKESDADKSPFGGVETFLQKIDSQKIESKNTLLKHWIKTPRSYEGEMTTDETRHFWKKGFQLGRGNKYTGRYVKKEIFDELEDDPFVYEIYLEVLAAQAQFEAIFDRPWGSVKHSVLGDLSNYLFVPYITIEKVREYLRTGEERRGKNQTSLFSQSGPRV